MAIASLCLLVPLKYLESNQSARDRAVAVSLGLVSYVAALLLESSLFYIPHMLTVFVLYFIFLNDKPLSVLKTAIKISLISLPLMIILFFIFPRIIITPIWFNPFEQLSKTGFSDELRPGEIEKMVQDETILFEGVIKSENGVFPDAEKLYWRGAVLTSTDGFNWKSIPLVNHTVLKTLLPEKSVAYEVFYDTQETSTLFTLEYSSTPKGFGRSIVLPDQGLTYRLIAPYKQKIYYQTNLINEATISEDKIDEKKFLTLPKNTSAFLLKTFPDLINEIKKTNNIAKTLSQFFVDNKFSYSYSPGQIQNLEDFLLQKKIGLCEHYAAASAALLRASGIPARVVVGLQGGQSDESRRYIILRKKDAHAWIEFLHPTKRNWERFDPTDTLLPVRLSQGIEASLLALNGEQNLQKNMNWLRRVAGHWPNLQKQFQLIYFKTNQSFLNYDREEQRQTLSLFKEALQSPKLILIIKNFVLILFCISLLSAILIYIKARTTPLFWQKKIYQQIKRKYQLKEVPIVAPRTLAVKFPLERMQLLQLEQLLYNPNINKKLIIKDLSSYYFFC
jgi:transglutaminase-like putative cysteine protease